MKKLSKIVSLMLSLALCLGMASPAFTANFTDLQNAIDGKEGNNFAAEDGSIRYGYAENKDDAGNHVSWGIEAWEENGTRNVKLNEDVVRDDNDIIHYNNNRTAERKVINLGNADLVLDLNGQKIDGDSRDMHESNINGMVLKGSNSASTATIKNGTITGSQKDGIFAAGSGTLHLENVDAVGNKGTGVDARTDFTMTGGSIKNNEGFGLLVGPKSGKGTFEVKDTTISGNGFQGQDKNNGNYGAGIFVSGDRTGTITNTTIEENAGRGIFISGGSDITLDKVTIQDNDGGIISGSNTKLTIGNSTIVGNHAPEKADHWSQNPLGGGIVLNGGATLELGEGNEIHSNTANGGSAPSDIYVANEGVTVKGLDKPSKAPEGQQFDGWYNGEAKYEGSGEFVSDITLVAGLHTHTPGEAVRENEVPAQSGVEGSYDLVVRCTVCGDVISSEHVIIPALPVPATPDDGGADAAPDAATIADQEVPLAGLMPVHMLLEELRQHEEIPEIELPEDFKWIDHEYAQAIYWGLQEELVVDAKEAPFDPDEVITAAILRNVLTNFAAYTGADFVVTVEGEDDEIVFDLGDRLTAFYTELEAALKAQEPKAA